MTKNLMPDVGLLGLNEFGDNPGLSPLWGAAIGGSVSGLSSLALGHVKGGAYSMNRQRLPTL